VYKPAPAPEPPLVDTPAPPRERSRTPAAAEPSRPTRHVDVTDDSLPEPPSGLPSVLD
jgi:hypothetical protein